MQAVPHNVGDKSSSNVDERYFCKHRARDTTLHAHAGVNLDILTLPQKRIWRLSSTRGHVQNDYVVFTLPCVRGCKMETSESGDGN